MIVVDSSALYAVLANEDDGDVLGAVLSRTSKIFISAATLVEISIVLSNRIQENGLGRLHQLMTDLRIEVVPLSHVHATLAVAGHQIFGRGTGHPAKLNFGDCFSYALAKSLDLPLLFKGDDFVHTDIRSALAAS